jgi:CRP-like cAMP-binding protein
MARPQIFDGLNDIDAATAKRRFDVKIIRPDELVIDEGEIGRAMACVVSGELRIVAGGAEVGRVTAGTVLGELGLFEDLPRTASVRALTESELWVLDREGYEELRDTLHPICQNIEVATLESQVQRLGAVGERVAALGLGVPTPRTAPSRGFFAAVKRLFGAGGARPVTGHPMRALQASPLFADAPEPALEPIASWFTALECGAGEFLCTEGEVGDQMFVLESGTVDIVVDMDGTPHQVDKMGPGSAFGMVSLARGGTRMASCVSEAGALVHRLDRAGWDTLIDEPYMVGSVFRRAVIRAFSDQLQYSNQQLAAWERRRDEDDASLIHRVRTGLSAHDDRMTRKGSP